MSERKEVEVPTGDPSAGEPTGECPTRAVAATLSARDRGILDFERNWKRGSGAKGDAINAEFGLTFARYYQVLNSIIDSPTALAYDPMLVTRLQRVRDTRMSARTLMPHPSDDNSRPR